MLYSYSKVICTQFTCLVQQLTFKFQSGIVARLYTAETLLSVSQIDGDIHVMLE